jgi:hypothetical protein
MDLQNRLHLWRLVIVYLALLGVYLILLGAAVAAPTSALKKRDN